MTLIRTGGWRVGCLFVLGTADFELGVSTDTAAVDSR